MVCLLIFHLAATFITNIHLVDNQCTCVFVGLKKGVEKTINTVTEVILNLKEAVMQAFGQDVVPQSYFVSSKARYKNYFEQEFLSCNCPWYSLFWSTAGVSNKLDENPTSSALG